MFAVTTPRPASAKHACLWADQFGPRPDDQLPRQLHRAFRLLREDRKAAVRLFRKALSTLDPTCAEHEELRVQIEANLKELGVSTRKAAPVRPAPTKK